MAKPETRLAIDGLVERLRDGDRSAGPELFRLLWPILRQFCSRLLADSSVAEDAAQRAITRVFDQASQFDPARDSVAWALEIAVWECRTERRRRTRSREVQWTSGTLNVADDRGTPPELLQEAELTRSVEQAMAGLHELDRETLLLFLGNSTADVPAATWRKRKERALRRLKLTWRSLYGLK